MQFKQLSELIAERDLVDAKIRRLRVIDARRYVVSLVRSADVCETTSQDLIRLVEKVNKTLLSVTYDGEEVDSLLDDFEALVELDQAKKEGGV